MIREVPGNSLLFTSYELLRRSLPGRPEDPTVRFRSFWEIVGDATSAIVCGGLAGMLMWSTILPLDVAKTRLQAASPGEKYNVRIAKQLIMVRYFLYLYKLCFTSYTNCAFLFIRTIHSCVYMNCSLLCLYEVFC